MTLLAAEMKHNLGFCSGRNRVEAVGLVSGGELGGLGPGWWHKIVASSLRHGWWRNVNHDWSIKHLLIFYRLGHSLFKCWCIIGNNIVWVCCELCPSSRILTVADGHLLYMATSSTLVIVHVKFT